jgi:hypothetical protein
MTMLDTLRSLTTKLIAPANNEVESVVRIKAYYADKVLNCKGDDHVYFLRALNRAETITDTWGLRTEFYNVMSRCFGELEAMRHTEAVQAMFAPFIARGHIKGVDSKRHGNPTSRRHSVTSDSPR